MVLSAMLPVFTEAAYKPKTVENAAAPHGSCVCGHATCVTTEEGHSSAHNHRTRLDAGLELYPHSQGLTTLQCLLSTLRRTANKNNNLLN